MILFLFYDHVGSISELSKNMANIYMNMSIKGVYSQFTSERPVCGRYDTVLVYKGCVKSKK